ncbi:vesicular glutamate transporter 2-like [Centruroides vittatus]|uniref:vesicular glutamate transporter 2-like n=1 Tax=Centruroides vittatus TaxID=120091 RepID=UPI00350F1A62
MSADDAPRKKEDKQLLIQESFEQDIDEGKKKNLQRYWREIEPKLNCCNLSKRHTVAALTSIGFVITFAMRYNLSVAIVQMVGNFTDQGPEFKWSPGTIGMVDSSFFWGYLITHVPGGFFAARVPANRMFGTAIAISSCLNLALPNAAHINVGMVVFIRILQGLAEGVIYPACHGIWRYWAPPLERSRLATIAFCGSYAGAVLGMPLSGMLINNLGWASSFYFYGLLGILWYIVWLAVVFERPSKHPTISAEERIYIEHSLGNVAQSSPTLKTTPWKAILTSLPVYAIIVANFCRSWTFYLLMTSQAVYFTDILHFQLDQSGALGALPHLLMTIAVPTGGYLADMLCKKGILTTTSVRKIFNCGGFGLEAIFLLVVGYTRSHAASVVALILAVGVSGFAITGFNVNHLDLAPRYASILMGMSNGVGTIAGIVCPVVVKELTKDGTAKEWENVFLISSIIHLAGVVFYAIFASGELQPWAEPPAEEVLPWNPLEGAFKNDKCDNQNGSIPIALTEIKQISYGTTDEAKTP